ncbi:MAG TPA: glutathione S-transferase family protein [Rhizomicrobium sp.]|jgi:glutathione S-transferase|nr:glutathione S-transferase family protein [Rhizomicrobium sp.]
MAAQYTLVIGTKDWSSWSLRPWLALKAVGAPFEEIVLRLRQPESKAEILKHSPSGKVPLLKISEGGRETSIWDSLAICEALAERHPEAGLWPNDRNTRAMARAYAAEMHSGFPHLRETLSMDVVRRHPTPELGEDVKMQIARIQDAWTHALSHHEGGFLFGRFSIADCMYAPVCTRFVTYGIEMSAPVLAYVERIIALPATQEWTAAAQKEVDEGLA